MATRVFPLALALLLVGCASAAPAPPLEVLSFNVRYANPGDGANAWEHRAAFVIELLRREDPDLLGLQEALPEQLAELRAALPGYRVLGRGRDAGGGGEHAALLVRASRFDVIEAGDFWLSPTPDEEASRGWDAALPRICTWAVLRDREGGAELLAMNAHFDHRGSEARRRSALVLLDRRARFAELPLVLTGDLNAGEGSDPLAALRAGGLRDTFRDAWPEADQVGTFHGFRGGTGGEKIDYVLVGAGWETLDAAILHDREGRRYPSDHYPVRARIRRR
ncbi:MAG: endonuclease/exonuclease/phosphatase family protein [Planctomycetota bacterium]